MLYKSYENYAKDWEKIIMEVLENGEG